MSSNISSSSSNNSTLEKHGDVVKFVTPELGGGPKDALVGMTRWVIENILESIQINLIKII